MFFKKKKEKSDLESAIESRTSELVMPSETVQEDTEKIKNLSELVEIESKLTSLKRRFNPNQVLLVVSSLVGTALIIWHERDYPVPKAIQHLPKPKF